MPLNKTYSSGTTTIDTSAEGSSYTGNITLTGNNAKFVIKYPEGSGHYGVTANGGQLHVEESVADGIVTRTYSRLATISDPEAKVGDTGYSTVYDAFYAIDGTTDNKAIVLQKDVTNAGIVTNGTAVNAAGETVATFDLNGHSIGIGSVACGNNADYTLTIIDSSEGKTGTVTNTTASLFILALTGINDYSGTYNLKVQGGTWQFDPSCVTVNSETHDLVDDGYYARNNGNGTWTVCKAIATIGKAGYPSLADAIDAVQSGQTILMRTDVTNAPGLSIPTGKNFTVDFGGHTYTLNKFAEESNSVKSRQNTAATPRIRKASANDTGANGFQLEANSTVTFQNGTINVAEDNLTEAVAPAKNVTRIIQNYANLNLESMVIDGTNLYGSNNYVMSFNNGTNTLNDTQVIIGEESDNIAFDVCRSDDYESVSVNVTGTSLINGDVEVSATDGDPGEGFSLMLAEGTLDGEILLDETAKTAMAASPETVTISKGETETLENVSAPEGYMWVDNGNGTSTLAPKVYVAQIGNVQYESLAAAVAAVPTDGTETTITMIASEAINVVGSAITIPANKNIILDLNGYQVVGIAETGATSALISNRGTLTIKDSSDTNADGTGTGQLISGATTTWVYDGSGNYAGSYASNTITNTGTLTIQSGYIENLSTGSATYAVDNNSSGADAILNVQGGLLKAQKVAVRQFANSTVKENTVNVTGGTIQGTGYAGIWVQLPGSDATKATKATLNVSGGTLTGANYAFYDYSFGNNFNATQYNLSDGTYNGDVFSYGANMEITDGTFNGDVVVKQSQPSTIAISGGTFTGEVYTYGDNASQAFISGGTFSEPVAEAYCAEGYIPEDNGDGTYGVKTGTYVAQIGSTKYESLAEAVAAVQSGDTITMIADVTNAAGMTVPEGKNFTLDFGGHTYTLNKPGAGSTGTETNGFQLLKNSTITFRNGTINISADNLVQAEAPAANIKRVIQNYANLTLENMVIDGTNQYDGNDYILSFNNGTSVIKNTTVTTGGSDNIAFDVCRYASYPQVGVTVTGENSVINGNIEVYASNSNAQDGFSLLVEEGTLNGEILLDNTAKTAMAASPETATVSKGNAASIAAPADYKWVDNGDGSSTLAPKVYVAQIDDVQYETLAEAVAAVPTDGTETTITMIADETIVGNTGVTIAATQNVVLDLNGKTISQTGPMAGTAYLIRNNGTLTILDSTDTEQNGTGNGKMLTTAEDPDTGSIPSYATNLISNYGTLSILSGYYEALTNEGYASYVVDNYSGGTANISGGKLCNNADYAYVVRMFLNSTTQTNALNISGTAIITGSYAVWMQYANANANKASLNISGGTLEATDGYALYAGGGTRNATNITVDISGGHIGGDGAWLGSDTAFESISVSGGTFAAFGVSAVGGSRFITGGTYESTALFTTTRNDETPILADTYEAVEYSSDRFVVEQVGYFTLIDGEAYERAETIHAESVTYRRTFKDSQVGKYQAWFVPFDYTIKNEDAENFTFYKIDFVSHSPLSGVVEDNSAVFINIEVLTAGKTLKGNRPYIVKPNTAETFDFVAENVNLLGIDESSRLKMSTSVFEYNFYGNYGTYSTSSDHELLAMNGGQICWNTAGAKLGSYRWYIKASSNFSDDDYSKLRFIIIGDEEDNPTAIDDVNTVDDAIDAYYTVDGMKLESPAKGLNIVKYKSGRTKKVYIQ